MVSFFGVCATDASRSGAFSKSLAIADACRSGRVCCRTERRIPEKNGRRSARPRKPDPPVKLDVTGAKGCGATTQPPLRGYEAEIG